ncbi:AraC family transcriptional regulator [Halioglobus maricola]|uniref:AraC family transcriptional regulator n=1 Tax=Halioglobus maricola TaxID=2601894 RepID=A0A5P9NIC3_9GAMM|nr:AraC family transcriptional regulator [Halioglobus maricola]QFU75276.1 AraC family transcriptional regulator [Halioglobus maricola]
MQAASVSNEYVKSLLKGAIKRGYDPGEILANQGLPRSILTNPRFRISTLQFAELNQALTELMDDELVGLAAKPSPVGTLALMSRASLSCDTFWESLQVWRECLNLMDNSMSAETMTTAKGGLIAMQCEKAADINDNYLIESQLSGCHRFHCWLANDFVPIERVDLAFAEPAFSAEHRYVFYGAPVYYSQPHNAMYFGRESLEIKNLRDRDALEELLSSPLAHMMRLPRQSSSLSIKVRLWMEKSFREGRGTAQMDLACSDLAMTEQTMRRHLRAEGNTFQQLKEDTRRDMAIHFIKHSDLSIEKIAFRLGFAEASTFIRSFKRWMGVTPLAYRKL